MKNIFIGAVLAVLLFTGLFFVLNTYIYTEKQGDAPREEIVSYFQAQMFERGTADGLIPIEGFDAGLLLGKFPGLMPQDFDGVYAFEGVYEIQDGQPVFIRTQGNPVSSAASTVSKDGYRILLQNVTARLDMSVETNADIDALIDTLGGSVRVSGSIGAPAAALQLTITPIEVLEDSRCPESVECVWEGTVRINAELVSSSGSSEMALSLREAVTFGDYEVMLVDVVPAVREPQDSSAIAPSEYLFTFAVSKRDAQTSSTLEDNTWVWEYTERIDGTRVVAHSDAFVLSFDVTEGRLMSTTDCNSLSGSYMKNGEMINAGPFAMTKMFCRDSQEGEYVEALTYMNAYTIEGDTLTIFLADDFGTMVFKRAL